MKGILCFGDSITYGQGDEEKKGWCGRLKEWFEKKEEDNGIYNLGIGGQTSGELLKRFEIECEARMRFKHEGDAYTIIISIGTNDTKYEGKISQKTARVNEEDFRNNIKALIKEAKAQNAKTAFLGITPVKEDAANSRGFGVYFQNERINKFNNIIKEECKKERIGFLDINEKMLVKNYKKMLADGLHPNSKGYDFMFEKIKEFLLKDNLLP